jgi:membrane-associated phospholipid phosphatase
MKLSRYGGNFSYVLKVLFLSCSQIYDKIDISYLYFSKETSFPDSHAVNLLFMVSISFVSWLQVW